MARTLEQMLENEKPEVVEKAHKAASEMLLNINIDVELPDGRTTGFLSDSSERMSSTLHLKNLGKSYGDHFVFRGLNHTFSPGCYALCEEESTGKSTLLGIIAGVIAPGMGDVLIDGHSLCQDPQQAKARLAYVPDNCLEFPQQTGRGFLEQAAAAKGVVLDDVVLGVAHDLGLEAHLDKRFEQMSTGTRRKVYIVAAALADPAVVVADGPSAGLDASARGVLAERFKTWGQSRVVLFASHDPVLVQACGAKILNLSDLQRQ